MRRRPARKPNWWRAANVAWACLLVGAAACGPWLFERYRRHVPLRVRDVRVEAGRVIGTLDVLELTGIRTGIPLFGNWLEKGIEKLQDHPRVAKVEVVRTVTGDLTIRVSERPARAAAHFDDLYAVDSQGRVMERLKGDDTDRVVLSGPWTNRAPRSDHSGTFRRAFKLIEALAAGGFEEAKISEIHFDPSLGFVVYRVGSKARVVFGHDLFAEKTARLRHVLDDFATRERMLKEIDLDFRDRAIVKLNVKGVRHG